MNRCTIPIFLFPSEQLTQGALSFRSDLDTDNARNLMEPSPEETSQEIMLGKVTNILSYKIFGSLSLHQRELS